MSELFSADVISIEKIELKNDECTEYSPVKSGCDNGNIDAGERINLDIEIEPAEQIKALKLEAYSGNSAVYLERDVILYGNLGAGESSDGDVDLVFEIGYDAVRDQEQIQLELIITGKQRGRNIREIKQYTFAVTKLIPITLKDVDFTDDLKENNFENTNGFLDYGDPYGKVFVVLHTKGSSQFDLLSDKKFDVTAENEFIKIERVTPNFQNGRVELICLIEATEPKVYNKNRFDLTFSASYRGAKYTWQYDFSQGRERYGGLEINTTKEDLKTYLNNQLIGEDNFSLDEVGACLANKLYFTCSGGEPQELIIPIKEGKTTVVRVELCEQFAEIVPLKTLGDYDIRYKNSGDFYDQFAPSDSQLRPESTSWAKSPARLLVGLGGAGLSLYYWSDVDAPGAAGTVGLLALLAATIPFGKEKPNTKNITYNNNLKSEARKKARDAASAENIRLTEKYTEIIEKENKDIEALNAKRKAFNSKEKEKIVLEYAIR